MTIDEGALSHPYRAVQHSWPRDMRLVTLSRLDGSRRHYKRGRVFCYYPGSSVFIRGYGCLICYAADVLDIVDTGMGVAGGGAGGVGSGGRAAGG